jgi:hypothetical protein
MRLVRRKAFIPLADVQLAAWLAATDGKATRVVPTCECVDKPSDELVSLRTLMDESRYTWAVKHGVDSTAQYNWETANT